MLLRPGRAFDSSMAAARSHPLMIVVFFLTSLPTAGASDIEELVDPWIYLVAVGRAVFIYFLWFRILDWSARFLGGTARFERVRWVCFLLGIPLASMAIVSYGLLWLQWAGAWNSWFWGTVTLAEFLIHNWILIVSVLVVARLYDFSAGRTIMAGLLPFLTLYIPATVLVCILWLADL